MKGALTTAALLLGAAVIAFFIYASSIKLPEDTKTVAANAPELLELKSARCVSGYGYQHMKGEVTNISDVPLKNVEAIGIFRDANGTLITSDRALIEYSPLMPGQSSPFDVIERGNPLIRTCNVDFKFLGGPQIRWRNFADTVTYIQMYLQDLGFYKGKLDGQMGPGTKAAIEAFQRKQGMAVDGEADQALLDKLRAMSDPDRESGGR